MPTSTESKNTLNSVKPTIGRSEKIVLPQFGIKNADAKIDTGAYSSSMHCSLIDVVTDNGKKMLKIIPLRFTDKPYRGESFLFPYAGKKKIKNSFGKVEERYVIKTAVRLFGKDIMTEFSLTDRTSMKYSILLGRKFLIKNFVVDVALKDRSAKADARASKKKSQTATL